MDLKRLTRIRLQWQNAQSSIPLDPETGSAFIISWESHRPGFFMRF